MRYCKGASFSAFAEPQYLGDVNRRTLGPYVSYREHLLVLADQLACKIDSLVEREPGLGRECRSEEHRHLAMVATAVAS